MQSGAWPARSTFLEPVPVDCYEQALYLMKRSVVECLEASDYRSVPRVSTEHTGGLRWTSKRR